MGAETAAVEFSSHSAQEGTLTLGSSHTLSHGKLQVDLISRLIGKLSLFRVWGRERTAHEVTSRGCTEGNLVRWEEAAWNFSGCIDRPESRLSCGELKEHHNPVPVLSYVLLAYLSILKIT